MSRFDDVLAEARKPRRQAATWLAKMPEADQQELLELRRLIQADRLNYSHAAASIVVNYDVSVSADTVREWLRKS